MQSISTLCEARGSNVGEQAVDTRVFPETHHFAADVETSTHPREVVTKRRQALRVSPTPHHGDER